MDESQRIEIERLAAARSSTAPTVSEPTKPWYCTVASDPRLTCRRPHCNCGERRVDSFAAAPTAPVPGTAARAEVGKWISVKDRMPTCPRNISALGTPVLIWPKKYGDQIGTDGFAYYGKRATGSPAFYLYGSELHGVTHWQPFPDGPSKP